MRACLRRTYLRRLSIQDSEVVAICHPFDQDRENDQERENSLPIRNASVPRFTLDSIVLEIYG